MSKERACANGPIMSRRALIATAPAAGLAALVAGAERVQALTGEIIEPPYLHVVDRPVPGSRPGMKPGDMLLILPGLSQWDDTHLMRSGDFAAVQVTRPDGLVHICYHGTRQRLLVSREQAKEIVAGSIAGKIRLVRGRWIA
ncbi:MAG: hypothetical protein HLUCCA12_06550 [Rhodobacteraceae bacterium HLUCCA12]|nr:MAG: hypothetical protein HLUCCA12_06550 [Rhodobacteraceae bacterium HLUCCA12]